MKTPYQALQDADAALVCTEWDVFRKLDWDRAGKVMARKLVIDGRESLIRPRACAKKVLSTTPSAASNCVRALK